MNASQFMDKQIQGLAASAAAIAASSPPASAGLADLMSPDPQEEAESHAHHALGPHHGAGNGSDEVLPSYDFQPIRPATSASAVPVGSAPAAAAASAWGSLDSKAASANSLKVCRPKELGGLSILDLQRFGWALRVRWLWLSKTEPERPWSSLPVQVHSCAKSLFSSAIVSEVGNGANTKFWTDKWLDGCSIEMLAPNLFACVPKRRSNRRTVQEALINNMWVGDIQGHRSVTVLAEYFDVWSLVQEVVLQPDIEDSHKWRFEASGQFSTKSAYEAFFNGSVYFQPCKLIWGTWAPRKCKFFLWLVAHNRCWTANRLARRGLPHPEQCPLCDQEGETINHLLSTCVFARQLWHELFSRYGLQELAPQADDLAFYNWWQQADNRVHTSIQKGFNTLVVLGAWSIWKTRNDVFFNQVAPRIDRALLLAREEAELWSLAGAKGLNVLVVTELPD